MKEIIWDGSLSIGVEAIDEQHKTWIQRINDITNAIDKNLGPRRIAETVNFLIDYTYFHFTTEENFMRQYRYAELEAHKTRHKELKATLGNLEQDFQEEGATYILAESLNTFLENWLIKHIKEVDQKFGEFLKDKGIEISLKE
jgi:hemerythrin